MTDSQPSLFETLQQQLREACIYDSAIRQQNASGQPLHIPGAGKAISSAYEQLRNATEYTDEYLRLQRSIRRYYKRTLFILKRRPEDIGMELIVELLQAGYLQKGQFSSQTAQAISEIATQNMQTYHQLRDARVPQNKALDWTLAIMSVKTENILDPHTQYLALANFAHQSFLQQLPKDRLVKNHEETDNYEIALYGAIHKALLKSDMDIVRADLLRMFSQTPDDIKGYIAWNEYISELYTSSLTARLKRIVSKNGAPFQILRSLVEDVPDLADILPDREQFLQTYTYQTEREYKKASQRLTTGLTKSIIFILITKTIIGIGIEVPFDLLTYGSVAPLPLIINLLFPPIYMASIRIGLTMPSVHDAIATRDYMDHLLYSDHLPNLTIRERVKGYSLFAKCIYTALFLVPFAVTVLLLKALTFNPLQMVIFFLFFSTASFLGFRLSSMVRELKMGRHQVALISVLQDFFYLPFILLGQWLAGRYARVNAVGEFLDLAIELPLKAVLYLIRLTIRFLHEKHEELYD